MTSNPRLCPSDKPPEPNNYNKIQENELNRQSKHDSAKKNQNSLQNKNDSPTNEGNSAKDQQDGLLKKDGSENSDDSAKNDGPQTPIKCDNILKKNNLVNRESQVEFVNSSLRDSPIKQVVSIALDGSVKQDTPINHQDTPKQDALVHEDILVKKEDSNKKDDPVKSHAPPICWKCGHFTKPERCKECSQIITPRPERCSGCGQIIPETCNACGQVIPIDWNLRDKTGHSRSLDRHFGYGYYDKWSYDGAFCRASTSRKLFQSSGDYDSDSCNSQCSCQSVDYSTNVYEKPCIIADSATLLNRSKWTKFKKYFRSLGRKGRYLCTRKCKSKRKKAD